MKTFVSFLTRLLCTLLEWFVSIVAMELIILVGEYVAASLLFVTTILFTGLPLYGGDAVLASFAHPLYLFPLCIILGSVVGSLRSLWVRRETGQHHLVPMSVINTLAVGIGLPLMYLLSSRLPDLFPTLVGCTFTQQDQGECFMNSDVFLVAGRIYGLAFGILLGFAEWLALRRPAIRLWLWLSISGCAWALWCGVIAQAFSRFD